MIEIKEIENLKKQEAFSLENREKAMDEFYCKLVKSILERKDRAKKEIPTFWYETMLVRYEGDLYQDKKGLLNLLRWKYDSWDRFSGPTNNTPGSFDFMFYNVLRDCDTLLEEQQIRRLKLFALLKELYDVESHIHDDEYLRYLYNLFIIEGHGLLNKRNFSNIVEKFRFR